MLIKTKQALEAIPVSDLISITDFVATVCPNKTRQAISIAMQKEDWSGLDWVQLGAMKFIILNEKIIRFK